MSRLDDILDGYMAIMYRDKEKRRIKDLMLELIGEDTCICGEQSVSDCDALWHYVNDLRQKVNEL